MAGVEDVLVIEKAPALRTKSQGAIRLLSRQQDWHVADLGSISAQLPDTLSSVGAKFEPTRDLQESYGEKVRVYTAHRMSGLRWRASANTPQTNKAVSRFLPKLELVCGSRQLGRLSHGRRPAGGRPRTVAR